MLRYIIERIFSVIPTVLIITVVGFIIIELPPGDYLTYYLHDLEAQGNLQARQEVADLQNRYALDRPAYERFFNGSPTSCAGTLATRSPSANPSKSSSANAY